MGSHFQMRALVAPLSTGPSLTYLTTSRGVTNGRVISQSELDLTAPRTYCPPTHRPTHPQTSDPPTDPRVSGGWVGICATHPPTPRWLK